MKCTQCLNRCNKMQCNWLGKIYSSHFPVAIFSILCVCTHLIFVNCFKVLHVGMMLWTKSIHTFANDPIQNTIFQRYKAPLMFKCTF